MTISQSSSNCTSDVALGPVRQRSTPSPLSALIRRWAGWREKQRTVAELARLAATGSHLLRDIGLDPGLTRHNPAAALAELQRRGR